MKISKGTRYAVVGMLLLLMVASLGQAAWLVYSMNMETSAAIKDGFLGTGDALTVIAGLAVYALIGAAFSPFIREAWPYSLLTTAFFIAAVFIVVKRAPLKWRKRVLELLGLSWLANGLYFAAHYITG